MGWSSFVGAKCASRRVQRSAMRMALQVGDQLPMELSVNVDGESMTVEDIFKGKTVAVCAVPGALTPTCTESHAPSFVKNADKLKEKGIEDLYVLSVNDLFVMKAFLKQIDGEGVVKMIADGDAAFTKAVGLEKDTGAFGGIRSARYSMVANDGVVAALNVDTGAYEKSSAEYLLGQFDDENDPLAQFCKESPEADECRSYDS